jgi:hypothetical protein
VLGKLGEALSMKEGGWNVLIGDIGKLNTASGTLDWRHMKKGGKVKTPLIYYKIGGVERSMSVQETARVSDFPGTRTSRMTDKQIKILTDNEIPRKVITASIFFLTTWNKELHTSNEERHTLCEVQVDSVKEEIDYRGRNRDNQGIAIDVEPRDSNGIASTDKAKDDERLIEEINHNYESRDQMTEHVREKATRSDESAVPFYLWNDRVMEKLNKHWTSRGMEPVFDSNDRLERLRVIRALRLLRGAAI